MTVVISSQFKYSVAQSHAHMNYFLLFSSIPLLPRNPNASGVASKMNGQSQTEPAKVI